MKCIKCRHRNANPIQPTMADLPRKRSDDHVFQFTYTRVDYFGPIWKKFLQIILKRWCCFCLATREVRIEVAQTSVTGSYLAARTRLFAWRGYPNTINSDNGANFVGAANELKAYMNACDKAKIESGLAQKRFENVEKSTRLEPHNLVNSGRDWFKVAGNTWLQCWTIKNLANGVLSITLCRLVQILNARPLTAVSDDLGDLTVFASYHFLLGREDLNAKILTSSERYQDLKKIWTKIWNLRNLKQGELQWLIDDSLKRCLYKLGLKTETFTGNDGVVLSARVKFEHGELNWTIMILEPGFY